MSVVDEMCVGINVDTVSEIDTATGKIFVLIVMFRILGENS